MMNIVFAIIRGMILMCKLVAVFEQTMLEILIVNYDILFYLA